MADSKQRILITGMAGFIGYHLAKKLGREGFDVYGVDSINDYYSTKLKKDRLLDLGVAVGPTDIGWISNPNKNIHFLQADLSKSDECARVFEGDHYDALVHLAAQQTDAPVSLYAATKKSTEIIAHYYAHQYKIDTSMLRFFTVYGPWGRPDMAVYGFFDKIMNGEEIKVFNQGDLKRDFTYISDIVDNLHLLLLNRINKTKEDTTTSYEIYNIGNQSPVKLLDFISLIEKIANKKAKKAFLPMQPGDVYETYADSNKLKQLLHFDYNTPLEKGLTKFYEWYKTYHTINTKALQSHE